jgi:hypothetical protein
MSQPKFKIGQQFKTRGKFPKICTIRDIWKTYDSKGELVRLRYVATHELIGQLVWDRDVCETTVAMGLVPSEL